MKSQWTTQKIPVDIGHTVAAKLKDKILDTKIIKDIKLLDIITNFYKKLLKYFKVYNLYLFK